MASIPNQWSNLPNDMLLIIFERLDSITDILRLRAVCSSWRSSFQHSHLRAITSSPLLSVKFPFPMCPNQYLNLQRRGHFTLSQSTIYYIEPYVFTNPSSSRGWIVHVDKSQSGKMQLFHPLDRFKKCVNLPQISSKVVNMLDFRVSEVSKVEILKFVRDWEDDDTDLDESISFYTQNVATSDYAILTTQLGKLAYYNLGDEKWTMIDDGQALVHYVSLLYRKGKFYALNYRGRMIVIDSGKIINAVESPLRHHVGCNQKYLVESLGDLYMLDKHQSICFCFREIIDLFEGYPNGTVTFLVYKFNDNTKEWVQVTSLGDQAFFLGDGSCFSVSAKQLPSCKTNCIYFTDLDFPDEDEQSINGVWIFDLGNCSVGPLSSSERYSQIFWPPPTWLKLKSSSELSSNPSNLRMKVSS